MATRAEAALTVTTGTFLVVSQNWSYTASTTPLSKRPKEILLERTSVDEPTCEITVVNAGVNATDATKNDFTYAITARDTWLEVDSDVSWTAVQEGSSNQTGTTKTGTLVFLSGVTLNIDVTTSDSLLQSKTANGRIAGSLAFGLGEIRWSEVAKYGGQFFYRYPGDWYAWINGEGNSSDGTVTGIDGYKNWRFGYCRNDTRNVTWMNGGDLHIRDRWAQYWMFAKNSDTGQDDGADNEGEENYGSPWISGYGEMHPGMASDGVPIQNVIRWRPPHNGTIRTTGFYFTVHSDTTTGVNFWFAQMNGIDPLATNANRKVIVKSESSANESFATWDKTMDVTTDDVFYMVLGPASDETSDTTHMNINIWYVDFASTNSGVPTNSNVSWKKQIEGNARYLICMPNYKDSDGVLAQTLGRQNLYNRGEIKASHYKNSFLSPDTVRTDESKDTATGAGTGNGFITIQALTPPSPDAVIKYKMITHQPSEDLDVNYDITNKWNGTYTTDSQLQYTFDGLTGGLYQVGMLISSQELGFTDYDLSQVMVMPGGVWVERGLVGYTK